jgi:hypothetical protein
MLKDFVVAIEGNAKLQEIRARVEAFSETFPMPGFSVSG